MKNLILHISQQTGDEIVAWHSVSGGSISDAYLLEGNKRKYFLKTNTEPFAEHMFETERIGLETIESSQTIAVPHVHLTGKHNNNAFILMDYVESKQPTSLGMERLGRQLAQLHQTHSSRFGLDIDNYIGKLPQSNTQHNNWVVFYWNERLIPQLQMAIDKKLYSNNDLPKTSQATERLTTLLSETKPSLVHGDLWGGNYLIDTQDKPYLIDPAIHYGHPMVDIAMSKLFGGFSSSFYYAYHEQLPQPSNYLEQIDLYQLYFLLVHLNLFGRSYYSSVMRIIKRYLL